MAGSVTLQVMLNAAESPGRCPLCHGESFKTAFLELHTCDVCALVISPAIWRVNVNEEMEREWFEGQFGADASFWVRTFEALNNRRTIRRIQAFKTRGRLLEIGPGTGSFLAAARKSGYAIRGCDLSRTVAASLSTRGIDVHCGVLRDLRKDEPFDVIVMNHVVEHVSDPVGFLREASELLADDGIIHLAVPNIACVEASLSGWISYQPYHLVYFTPHTLKYAVHRAGLVPCEMSTHESFSGWFLALVRSALRNGTLTASRVGRSSSSSAKDRSALVEHCYRLAMVGSGVVTWPLRWLQAVSGRGDEIICIVRKAK